MAWIFASCFFAFRLADFRSFFLFSSDQFNMPCKATDIIVFIDDFVVEMNDQRRLESDMEFD